MAKKCNGQDIFISGGGKSSGGGGRDSSGMRGWSMHDDRERSPRRSAGGSGKGKSRGYDDYDSYGPSRKGKGKGRESSRANDDPYSHFGGGGERRPKGSGKSRSEGPRKAAGKGSRKGGRKEKEPNAVDLDSALEDYFGDKKTGAAGASEKKAREERFGGGKKAPDAKGLDDDLESYMTGKTKPKLAAASKDYGTIAPKGARSEGIFKEDAEEKGEKKDGEKKEEKPAEEKKAEETAKA